MCFLGPEAPEDWRGALDITYRLGPGYTNNKIIVTLEVNNYYEVKPFFNVIGTMYGDVEPDRYVLIGNHRDAWVNGAVDAGSGTTVTTEIARGLGELKKAGWKPRRTIMVGMLNTSGGSCLVSVLRLCEACAIGGFIIVDWSNTAKEQSEISTFLRQVELAKGNLL